MNKNSNNWTIQAIKYQKNHLDNIFVSTAHLFLSPPILATKRGGFLDNLNEMFIFAIQRDMR